MRRRSTEALKDRSLRLTLTDEQLAKLHEAAAARGLAMSTMVRTLALRFADLVLSDRSNIRQIGLSAAETDSYVKQAVGTKR